MFGGFVMVVFELIWLVVCWVVWVYGGCGWCVDSWLFGGWEVLRGI